MLLSPVKKEKLIILDINFSITSSLSSFSKHTYAKIPSLIKECVLALIHIFADETRCAKACKGIKPSFLALDSKHRLLQACSLTLYGKAHPEQEKHFLPCQAKPLGMVAVMPFHKKSLTSKENHRSYS